MVNIKKEAKETWQLNTIPNPRLGPVLEQLKFYKGQYWVKNKIRIKKLELKL